MRKPRRIGFPTDHFSAYAYQEASSLLPAYLQEELSSHRLFEPVTPILKREAGYFLLWSSQRPMTGAALLLREWMRQTSADSTSGSKSKSENVTA
jgi:DNA-binding transcriptional LysR family regulator